MILLPVVVPVVAVVILAVQLVVISFLSEGGSSFNTEQMYRDLRLLMLDPVPLQSVTPTPTLTITNVSM
jgi:hypothetical protein